MKILIIGASGQVGSELKTSLLRQFAGSNEPADIIGVTRADLNLSNPDQIKTCIEATSPDFIINAAAYTAVDAAEKEVRLAHITNAVSLAEIDIFMGRHAACFYISTIMFLMARVMSLIWKQMPQML